MEGRLERKKVLDLKILYTLHELKGKVEEIKIDGCRILVDSERYDNFYYNGLTCVKCGLTATYAAIEKTKGSKRYHINFYGVRPDGKEIVFTKDHIYPKSLGGFDTVDNFQTMCACCNGRKGDKTDMTIDEAVEKGYTSYERANIMAELNKERELLKRLNKMVAVRNQNISRLANEAYKVNPPISKKEYR